VPRRRTSTTSAVAAVINDEKKESPRIGDENPGSATINPKWPQIGRREEKVAEATKYQNSDHEQLRKRTRRSRKERKPPILWKRREVLLKQQTCFQEAAVGLRLLSGLCETGIRL